MEDLFKSFPHAITNTQRIAAQCQFKFELGKPIFPSLELPEGESSFSCLWKNCFEGATSRYQPLTQEVIKRLEYELKTIHDLGFSSCVAEWGAANHCPNPSIDRALRPVLRRAVRRIVVEHDPVVLDRIQFTTRDDTDHIAATRGINADNNAPEPSRDKKKGPR